VTSRGQTLSVLIADDHDLFAASLAELLAGEGLDVVGRAADGAEAVALASRLRPDVVVIDVSMPCCDGIEAAREITGTLETTRVVMLTGIKRPRGLAESPRRRRDRLRDQGLLVRRAPGGDPCPGHARAGELKGALKSS
jgi:CheY-like chemotaxis protein